MCTMIKERTMRAMRGTYSVRYNLDRKNSADADATIALGQGQHRCNHSPSKSTCPTTAPALKEHQSNNSAKATTAAAQQQHQRNNTAAALVQQQCRFHERASATTAQAQQQRWRSHTTTAPVQRQRRCNDISSAVKAPARQKPRSNNIPGATIASAL